MWFDRIVSTISIILVVLGFMAVLGGCSPKIEYVEKPIITTHPSLPRPVNALPMDWDIVELNDKIYVVGEYTDYLNFLIYQEDILRYTQQSKNVMCFYRVDLNEEFCNEEKEKEKEKEK